MYAGQESTKPRIFSRIVMSSGQENTSKVKETYAGVLNWIEQINTNADVRQVNNKLVVL
jgi:hypothetical protein